MSWKELAHDYVAIAEAKRGASSSILFLVFIIAAVGISNTMLMAMYERIRELGMMRALGMSDKAIHLSFIFEAGGIGLLGALIGTAIGVLINVFLVNKGIDLSFIMRDIDIGYRIQSIMRGSWSVKTIITSLASGVILSMIVAYFPTRRALKMDIPSCLHHI
jgi:ABC-type antimicrobial peptide transport system permease subunit